MKLIKFFAALTLLGGAIAAHAEKIWDQQWDFQNTFGYSVHLPDRSIDSELADDFDLTASIERVTIHGDRGFGAPGEAAVTGAWVRFYQWASGVPGAMLYEEFVPAGDRLLTNENVESVTTVLEHPFRSEGKTFVSVQMVMDQPYYWYSSRSNSPRNAPVMMRDRANGGGWNKLNFYGELTCDAVFELNGTITGAAKIENLDRTAATRSGRVRLFANNLGENRGTGRVLVGGEEAWVTKWNTDGINFYVPESLTPGNYDVVVDNGNGPSATTPLQVLDRTSDAHLAWKFQVDGPWIDHNYVGKDGSIYFVSQYGMLYCVGRDGGLKWLSNQYEADIQGVVDADASGNAYVGINNAIRSFDPLGHIRWTFTDPAATTVIAGPTLGPDGNLYAATQAEGGGMGMMSLTPDGTLRWSNPVVSSTASGSEVIAFSKGHAIVSLNQHGVHDAPQTLAFDLDSGSVVWAVEQGANGPVHVDSAGNIYTTDYGHQVIALDADGQVRWTSAQPNGGFDVSQEGLVYGPGTQTGYRLFGLTPEGGIDWSGGIEDMMVSDIALDPTGKTLIGAARTNYGEPGVIVSYDVQGNRIWKQAIPDELNVNVVPWGTPAFSPEGDMAFIPSVFPQYGFNQYSYVFAVNVDHSQGEPAPAITALTVDPNEIPSVDFAEATVTLDKPAPEGGVKVFLSTDEGFLLNVPSWVVVEEGQTAATFEVNTGWSEANASATIRAELGGVVSTSVTILAAPAYLAGVDVDPAQIEGGTTARGLVRLEGVAPAGGAVITLESSNPDVLQVPATVTVPEGAVKAWFEITTVAVEDNTEVDVWATYEGQQIGAFVTVVPGGGHPLFENVTIPIAKAETAKGILFVEARDTVHSAVLTVFDADTGEKIGNLPNHGNGVYRRPFKVAKLPKNIRVVSSISAVATAKVLKR